MLEASGFPVNFVKREESLTPENAYKSTQQTSTWDLLKANQMKYPL